ncbi:MAG: GGDEF domain-containing protein [Chloroflexi bacterium]|nr:GGDEF domain-containing protein [Chloroflexota bacterium]
MENAIPPNPTNDQLLQTLETLRRRVTELEAAEAERVRAVEALRQSEEKYRILLDDSSDPIFAFAPEGRYLYVNKAFADGVGRQREDIIDKTIWDVFPREEADHRYATVKWVFEHAATKVIEVRVPRADGDRYYLTTAKPILNRHGKVETVICISKEITERKRMEQELQYLSTHDTLTGLYNRNFFETELARLQPSRQFPVSIVIIDMDNLKSVNDQFGHVAGDQLIQKVAQFLRETFRAEDIIARIGGDEFALLLPKTNEAAVQAAVARLRIKLQQNSDARLNVSIGAATSMDDRSLIEVMRIADDCMYQEKNAHKKSVRQLDQNSQI